MRGMYLCLILLIPLYPTGRIIGLFRLSYLTPGLMAAGVTEVIVEKEQEQTKQDKDEETKPIKGGQKRITDQGSGKSASKGKQHHDTDRKSK